jgi:hypothetical protein
VHIINDAIPKKQSDVRAKVDIIGFCGCDMMVLEHLVYFQEMAKYCIACPSPIATSGFDFEGIFNFICNNADAETEQILKAAVELNYNYQVKVNDTFINHTAITCDHSKIKEIVESYYALLQLYNNENIMQLIVYARSLCLSYTATYYYDTALVDCIGFAKSMKSVITEDLELLLPAEDNIEIDNIVAILERFITSVQSVIIINKTLESFKQKPDFARAHNSHGVSMFFPDTLQQVIAYSYI